MLGWVWFLGQLMYERYVQLLSCFETEGRAKQTDSVDPLVRAWFKPDIITSLAPVRLVKMGKISTFSQAVDLRIEA